MMDRHLRPLPRRYFPADLTLYLLAALLRPGGSEMRRVVNRNMIGAPLKGQLWVQAEAPADSEQARQARRVDGVSSILITSNDFAAAWALDDRNQPLYPVVPGGERQREMAYRTGVNIVMYALTGNYKTDQVHVPYILDRLGQ